MLLSLVVTMITVVVKTSTQCSCHAHCCSDCQKVFVWIAFLTLCCASNLNSLPTIDKEDICKAISPRDAYFLEGEDIVLTCNGQDADVLTFARGGRLKIVEEKFIHKLNDTAIQLVQPNVTAKDIDSINHSVPYRCVNKNTTKCYDNIHLRLEYYPRVPQDLVCHEYNFKEMTCTWSHAVEYHRPEDIDVTCQVQKFMYQSDNPNAPWASCPLLNHTACHFNEKEYPEPFWMRINVSVTARNVTKEIVKEFIISDTVVPGPVINLRVVNQSKQGHCVELEWKPPHDYHSFKFVLTYKSPCSYEKTKIIYYYAGKKQGDETWSSRTVCGLTPYVDYTFSVKARLIEEKEAENKTYIEKGYWSTEATITNRTESNAIDVNPETAPGLYEISSLTRPGREGFASSLLYWKPLAECDFHDNADNVVYRVKAYNVTVTVKHPAFKAQIDVPESKIVNVTVQASNSIGHPENARIMTIYPKMFGPSPSELVVQYNKTSGNCVVQMDVVITENDSSFSNLSHTLVQCEKVQLSCQKTVTWKKLDVGITSLMLPSNHCDVDYLYGLVTYGYSKIQGQIVNTGIHWEPCIYQLGKVVDKPVKTFQLANVQPEKGFSVVWTPYNCNDMKAYISHYQIIYCQGQEQRNCTCTEAKVSLNISRHVNTYTASDLQDGTLFCVWVRGASKAGVGPVNSKPLVHRIIGKSGTVTYVLIAIVAIIVIFILCAVGVIIYRKKKKSYEKATMVTIPEEQNNLIEYSQTCDTEVNDNVEKRAENGRKYSLYDNLDGLPKEEGEDVWKLEVENNNQPDGKKEDKSTNKDGSVPSYMSVTAPDHTVGERNDVTDRKSVESHDRNLVDGYSDRVQVEPGHNRYSISSALSGAHNESVNHSIEDLKEIDHENTKLWKSVNNDGHTSEEVSTCTNKPYSQSFKKGDKVTVDTREDELFGKDSGGYKMQHYAKIPKEDKNAGDFGELSECFKDVGKEQGEITVIQQNCDNTCSKDVCLNIDQNEKFEFDYKPFHAACSRIEDQSSIEEQIEKNGTNNHLEINDVAGFQPFTKQCEQTKHFDKVPSDESISVPLVEIENINEKGKENLTKNVLDDSMMQDLENTVSSQLNSLSSPDVKGRDFSNIDEGIKSMSSGSDRDNKEGSGNVKANGDEGIKSMSSGSDRDNKEGSGNVKASGDGEECIEYCKINDDANSLITDNKGLAPNAKEKYADGHKIIGDTQTENNALVLT